MVGLRDIAVLCAGILAIISIAALVAMAIGGMVGFFEIGLMAVTHLFAFFA